MDLPRDTESIRRVLEHAAGVAYQRAQAQMENMNLQDAQHVRHLLEYAATEAIARAQEFEVPIAAFPGQAVGAVEGAFIGLWPILKRTLIIWSIGISLLVSSIAWYGLFYWTVQPGRAASEILFFDYSGISNHPAPEVVCIDEVDSCVPLLPTETFRDAPWAAVDFFSKHSQWEAHHYDVVPKPLYQSRVLQSGKGYFFEVALELPESEVNRNTGMFMVQVHLQSSNGTLLASSLRPSRLPHESQWISTIRKSAWLLPMIIGASHEARVIVVPSFRHFRESMTLPLQYATVSLIMQDKDRNQHRTAVERPLEVTRGEIRIGEELNDFQFMIRERFFTCYAIGVVIIYILQLAGLFLLRSYWNERQRARILEQMRGEQQDDPSENLELDEGQLESSGMEEPGISEDNDEWEELPRPLQQQQQPPPLQQQQQPPLQQEPPPQQQEEPPPQQRQQQPPQQLQPSPSQQQSLQEQEEAVTVGTASPSSIVETVDPSPPVAQDMLSSPPNSDESQPEPVESTGGIPSERRSDAEIMTVLQNLSKVVGSK